MPSDATARALAAVGVRHPGGDPAAQREQAGHWLTLGDHFTEQAGQVSAGSATPHWQAPSAAGFQQHTLNLANNLQGTAAVAQSVGNAQGHTAAGHDMVLRILRELGIQIAISIGFMALASVLPHLAAAAMAELTLLAETAGRAVQILVSVLRALARFMTRARLWLERLAKQTWRTERFSINWGRPLVDGSRDFVTDIVTNVTSSKILNEPIDPAKVFTSAAVSFAGGGLFGGLEGSGVKKVVDGGGNIRRGTDGLPEFKTFSDQVKTELKKIGPRPRPRPDGGPVVPLPAAAAARQRAARDEAAARAAGLLDPVAARRALGQAGNARRAQRQAVAARRDAQLEFDQAEAAFDRIDEFVRRGWMPQEAGYDSAQRLVNADTALARARTGVDTADAALGQARRGEGIVENLDNARDALRQVSPVRRFQEHWRHNMWNEGVPTGYEEVIAGGRRVLRPNAWEPTNLAGFGAQPLKGFSSPKPWQEWLIYDGTKDFMKSFVNDTVKNAIDFGQHGGDPNLIWKKALLSGAFAGGRGVFNGFGANVYYPKVGLEEQFWKIGTKGLDVTIRNGYVEPLIDPSDK
ncbi:hypothetical protein ACFOY4_35130 [Actinomadura syzygii]|uniref:hypothetical protein n=1 Tax=Actinomadura syzygii TaxID=1427538 RepID=UPI00361112DB